MYILKSGSEVRDEKTVASLSTGVNNGEQGEQKHLAVMSGH